MFDVTQAAVEGALAAGATYADARVVLSRSQLITARDEAVETLSQSEAIGVGARALIGSSWGFFATPETTTAAARRAGERAAEIARASALVAGSGRGPAPAGLVEVAPVIAHWESTYEVHPLEVSLSEKADLLVDATATMRSVAGISLAEADATVWDTEKWFVSSDGHRVSQRLVECGASMTATAVGDSETQRRSYPGIRGHYGTQGWELVRGIDLG
ncbi:MAG TPA: DNA gyrase modulator, partial [Acidimicrobiales bacterium]